MTNNIHRRAFLLSAGAAAIFTAFPSFGMSEEVAALSQPYSSLQLGIIGVGSDASQYGMYNGLRENTAYVTLGADITRSDAESKNRLRLSARDLGLDQGEVRVWLGQQGRWEGAFEYVGSSRFEPLVPVTRMTGSGTATQDITGNATPSPLALNMQRDALAANYARHFGNGWETRLSLKQEEKSGARMYGQGMQHFLTETIARTTRSIDLTLAYTDATMQFSGGYYGTSFDNQITSLTVSNGSGFTPMALPPDNSAQQVHFSGGFNLPQKTRVSFKLSKTRAEQDDAYLAAGLNGQTSLNGRVDTTLGYLNVTSRPVSNLSLLGEVRYEDRNDKTERTQYVVPGNNRTYDGFNMPRSIRSEKAKLEGTYRLPLGLSAIVGAEQEDLTRSVMPYRSVSFREETSESTFRLGLRRSLSEQINGAVTVFSQERTGSDWLQNLLINQTTGTPSNVLGPIHFADRDRKKVRLSLDWTPTEALTVQMNADQSDDTYTGRTVGIGPQDGEADFFSLDVTYLLNDEWQATAWTSKDRTQMKQAVAATSAANLKHSNTSTGIGVRGKPTKKMTFGADVQGSEDVAQHLMTASGANAPDIVYRHMQLKLFGTYAMNKETSVRLDLMHDRYQTDDWTWGATSEWSYSGGNTTVTQDRSQITNFVGASIVHSFR